MRSVAAVASTALPCWRRHAPTTLAAAALAGALVLAGPAATLPWRSAWPCCGRWAGLGRLVPAPGSPLAPLVELVRQSLRHLARDTWRLPAHRHGGGEPPPPDNLQPSLQPMIASRTRRPTSAYLLGVAHRAGLRLHRRRRHGAPPDATLSTLERLPRHRGHFLNWYDTRTLAVLLPAYVSDGRQRQPRRPSAGGGRRLRGAGDAAAVCTASRCCGRRWRIGAAPGAAAAGAAGRRVTHRLAQSRRCESFAGRRGRLRGCRSGWPRMRRRAVALRVPEVDAPAATSAARGCCATTSTRWRRC